VGLVAGALIGRGVDASREPGWKEEDLKTLATHELRSGESALLIYADTLWIGPIEQAANDFDATIYRRSSATQTATKYIEGIEIRTQTVDATYKSWEETLEQQRADLEALRQRASAAAQAEQAAIRQQIEKGNTKIKQFYHNMLHTLDVWGQQIEANISQVETEIKQANAQAKAGIEQRLTAARESQAALRSKVDATLSARLDDLKRDVESLRSQAATARSELQNEWNERIAQLETKREAEEKRLKQLREARGAAWNEMSKSVRQSIDTYEETVRQAEAEFHKGS
jgi:predicted  nucleic acid-binding Zn-ribbon protein